MLKIFFGQSPIEESSMFRALGVSFRGQKPELDFGGERAEVIFVVKKAVMETVGKKPSIKITPKN